MKGETMEEDIALKNVLEVVHFLSKQGWKIKKTSAYQHVRDGKLKPRHDGMFHTKDVDKYARIFLKRLESGTTIKREGIESAQERRIMAEADKMEAQAEHWRIKAKVASGEFVERSAFEIALSQRASIFKNDIESFCYARAPEIVRLCGGDNGKIPEVIEFMLEKAEEWLDRYSEDCEFIVPSSSALSIDDAGQDKEDLEEDTTE